IGQVASKSAGIMVVGPAQFLPFFTQPQQFLDEPGAASGPIGSMIYLADNAAARLFEAPLGTLTVGAAGKPIGIEIHVRTEQSPYPARNVVAILPGSDPKLRGEY